MSKLFRVTPDKIELFLPDDKSREVVSPEISIVVPALNEEITISEFVNWCWEGLSAAGVSGEIIIVDSSNDKTPSIALAGGARVLRTPKKGLGQAYLDAIPFIRGNFIIMGDCDLTYDFRKVKDFIESYRRGNEYVMGSRFKGVIEDGAMPALHRYFGTPLTTWMLNKIYRTNYSDIHCGMRGLTKNALQRIQLTSTGWEYASEMVLKAARVGLKIDEVPVTFYKDREGRFSHHRRAGFWSPWLAGWINLKVMLVYSPDSFLLKPGVLFFLLGLIAVIISTSGTFSVGAIGFGTNTLLLGVTLMILGYSLFQVGILARNIHGLRLGIEQSINRLLTYNFGMCTSAFLLACGFILGFSFLWDFISNGYKVSAFTPLPIMGLGLIILSMQTFTFTLLLELKRRLK